MDSGKGRNKSPGKHTSTPVKEKRSTRGLHNYQPTSYMAGQVTSQQKLGRSLVGAVMSDNQFGYEDQYMTGDQGTSALRGTGLGSQNTEEPFTPLDKQLHTDVVKYGLNGEQYGFEQDPEEEKVCV